MTDLKLPKLPARTPVKLTISLSPDLHQALIDYAIVYRNIYGEEELVTELRSADACDFPCQRPRLCKGARAACGDGAMSEQPRVGDRLLRLNEVRQRVGLGKTMIYEMIGEGRFPKPYKITPAARWSECEIDAWIAAVMASAAGPKAS